MLPTKFRFIRPSGFRGEEFKKSANQKQELPVASMFVNRSGRNEQSLQRTFHWCFLPSFGSFGQAVSEKIFRNRKIRKKNCMWQPCLLMKWAISIEDLPRMLPTKFRFIWPSGFREEDFFLEINQSETRIAFGCHACQRIRTKWAIFIKDLPRMLPTKFWSIWPSGRFQRRWFFF